MPTQALKNVLIIGHKCSCMHAFMPKKDDVLLCYITR